MTPVPGHKDTFWSGHKAHTLLTPLSNTLYNYYMIMNTILILLHAAARRITTIPINVCNPTPCGQNAVCINKQRAAACRCIDGFIGDPYTVCRRKPECVVHSDCPSVKSCQNERCVDPCIDTCGLRALCRVVNHLPICICQPGYEGDPFSACQKIELRKCMYFKNGKPTKNSFILLVFHLNLFF